MSPYEALGVRPSASPDEIRAAYRRAARRHHPDRGGSAERFAEIRAAYAILSDPRARAEHDRAAAAALEPTPDPWHDLRPGRARRRCAGCGGSGWMFRTRGLVVQRVLCPHGAP